MSLPTHFLAGAGRAQVGDVVTLDGDEGHHAANVRRLVPGEAVELVDGAGMRLTGTVTTVRKRAVDISVDVRELAEAPTPRLVAVQALAKGDRGELAVAQLTEVGVDVIVPWAAARSVTVWRGERAVKSHQKWMRTAHEAAKQSRRSWFPEVAQLHQTQDLVELVRAANGPVFVLHEVEAVSLASRLPMDAAEATVIVGPEGGISDDELGQLVAAGAVSVRLGGEVLRTSTAGAVALGAVLAQSPRWA